MTDVVSCVFEFRSWWKRRNALRLQVRDEIEREGGQIDEMGMIGFLIRSPFPPINWRPVYLRVDCRYPRDHGAWLICSTDRGVTHWVWLSKTGQTQPPVERACPVQVAKGVVCLPQWLSVALYILFCAALAGGLWYVIRV
jgi:hypothetical protein